MKEIKNFSKKYGGDISNFQATGGNISFKEDGFLYIKSSGYKILDIFFKQTLSKININGFFNDLKKENNISEDKMSELIENNNQSKLKSSIETGFHLLLDSKYVIHSHNIYINILLCMEGGEQILKSLFGNSIDIIDYKSPGLGLFNNISSKKNLNSIILLKNHGVISHGNTSFIELYNKINAIELVLKKELGLDDFIKLNNKKVIRKHIFPDSIVIDDLDIYSSHIFIKRQIKKIGGIIKYLSKEEVAHIRNMKTEKYRKRIFNIK